MPRRLLLINVVLAAVSVLCIVLIVKQLLTARPPAAPRGRPAVGSSAATAPAGDPRLPPQAYNVIASRNLFSPTRSETAGPAIGGGAPGTVRAGQLPNRGLMPARGPAQPSPRAFTPPGVPVPQPVTPGQPMPPPTVQQPAPGQPVPFGRPSPSLGRRIPPIPQDPSGQPLPAPTQ